MLGSVVVTKSDKREQAIRRNPNNARFDDLDTVLLDYGFSRRNRGTSHFVYIHPLVTDHVNIPYHGAIVKPIYVKKAIAAIDGVITAEREEKGREGRGVSSTSRWRSPPKSKRSLADPIA